MSGHSDLRMFQYFRASSILPDAASPACPAQTSNLEMISMTLAAVICDADDPCSVNTA